jgi:hypothetical protein
VNEIELLKALPGEDRSSDSARAEARADLLNQFGQGERVSSVRILRRPRKLVVTLATLLAAAGLATAIVFSTGGDVASRRQPEFAAAAVRVAEANPRLLVTAPGWFVKHAYGFEVDSGSMDFIRADLGFSQAFHLDWFPAHYYQEQLRDRANTMQPVRETLLGVEATTFHDARDTEGAAYETFLPPEGGVAVMVSAVLESRWAYQQVLRSLRRVDVRTWLGAMPREVVRAGALSATVEQMLRRIPLPPDFDRGSLPTNTFISDRYRLGTKVTAAVTCAWLERWLDAQTAGNEGAAREAIGAMNTARHWPVLLKMAREGGWTGGGLPPHGNGWASMILRYAREIRRGTLSKPPPSYDARLYSPGSEWAVQLQCGQR